MKTTLKFKLIVLISCLNLFSDIITAQVLAAGAYHSLYICPNSNSVWDWGYGQYGQLGNNSNHITNVYPLQVLDSMGNCCLPQVTAIAASLNHSMALSTDSTVWFWGDGASGDAGAGTSTTEYGSPVHVLDSAGNCCLSSIVAIATGFHHGLAVDKNGVVWAWGENTSGGLGDGNTTQEVIPVRTTTLNGIYITAVAGGGSFSLALDSAGTPYAWGNGGIGQLGDNSVVGTNSSYVHPNNLYNVKAIAAGEIHSLALKKDSTVWAFGDNQYGELGDGTSIQRDTPVQVHGPANIGFLTGIIAIAANTYHSAALRYDGTVWTWGDNVNGDLGNCNEIEKKYPVQVDSLSGIIDIALGEYFGLALKDDGTLYAWGDNVHGELGDGTFGSGATRDCPVKVKYLCSSLSVPQLSFDESVSVYPNPFTTSATIIFGDYQSNTIITLTDVLGKQINLYTLHNSKTLTIDKGDLKPGVYFVQIVDINHNVSNKKLLIQ